jgi:hypothetical protein
MDNLGSHKSKAVRRAIRATGAKLFLLPRYSPDLVWGVSCQAMPYSFSRRPLNAWS